MRDSHKHTVVNKCDVMTRTRGARRPFGWELDLNKKKKKRIEK